jgi:L-amino acid N-acyltransferase YncA
MKIALAAFLMTTSRLAAAETYIVPIYAHALAASTVVWNSLVMPMQKRRAKFSLAATTR